MLAIENAEEYIKLVKEFCLYTGVQRQLDAFRGNTPCSQMIKFAPYETNVYRASLPTWPVGFQIYQNTRKCLDNKGQHGRRFIVETST